ncbi:hypothetical protein [Pseudomonas putida]|uniref:Uncharacterized protein n=1 Tax=Pseudomonas putida TaxID=303 RepID=A0A8I1EBU5_PSEPU|nr:hypothetical protein [Pseudomonas putida]MBI6882482.1 hypothetical protein [Pseudomonas putida]
MRVLCVFELGSPVEAIHHLKQCAESLRRTKPGIQIYLALKGEAGNADLSWADKVLSTPVVKIKSERKDPGFWTHLHQSGWSDPQIRKVTCTIWSNLYRMVKPDYVIAAGSPSALLVASIDGIRGIQVGSGKYIPTISGWDGPCPFPELESWLFLITRHTASRLLSHPAIVFNNRSLDEPREGAVFNVYDDIGVVGSEGVGKDVIAVWDKRHPLTKRLRDFAAKTWGDRFVEMSAEALRVEGIDGQAIGSSKPLVVGNYDALSVNLAIRYDLPYIGSPLTKQQGATAEKCEEARISFRLDDGLKMLRSYADQPFALQAHALARDDMKVKAYADLDQALSFLLR